MLLRIRKYIFIADYLCRILGCRVALLKCVLSGLGIGNFFNIVMKNFFVKNIAYMLKIAIFR